MGVVSPNPAVVSVEKLSYTKSTQRGKRPPFNTVESRETPDPVATTAPWAAVNKRSSLPLPG